MELMLPYLWASDVDGLPANVCVDACPTLRHAYGQLGVRAELQPVDLVIEDEGDDRNRFGSLEPSWTGTSWNGHCVLVLPGLAADRGRHRGAVRQGPRLRALLRAVGDAPYGPDEARDIRFHLPAEDGQERWLRLDEIPLPPATPAAWPRP
ncbi:hypothetical protein [Streptomyces sp. NPDC005438]|uniref:hypothetical protein n=1 Tax=Streptomyces sp. NPDC005438 TaxID=3156880 RepID=UPI0033A83700